MDSLKHIEGIAHEWRLMVEALGPGWAFAIFVTVMVVIELARYRGRKQDRELFNQVIAAKEEQIQRLAEDNLMYRRLFFQDLGVPEEDLDRLGVDVRRTSVQRIESGPLPRPRRARKRHSSRGVEHD